MDRQTVYAGAIPLETDLLNTNKFAMIGLSKLAAAILGTSTAVNGLACTANSPASMSVNVSAGEIYSLQNIDGTAYSSLSADTTHQIVKQGILLDSVSLSCPAPTTNGFSINYLIEAAYFDQDANPVLLPYYNASNPSQSFSGANNNGASQNTTRKGVCSVQVKAGIAATTGNQVTPAADSGYVGLWVVTVAYGQTTITSANIAQAVNAPFLPAGGLVSAIQGSALTFAPDTGTANVYKAQYNPPITTLTDGLILSFKAKNTNTGPATFSPNGITASPIYSQAHVALLSGEIAANGFVEVEWNSSLNGWVLCENTGGIAHGATPPQFDNSQKLGTTQFIQRALGSFSGSAQYNVNPTLTTADIGRLSVAGSSGSTFTLPLLSAVPVGGKITIISQGGASSVIPQGADQLYKTSGSISSISVVGSDWVEITNAGSAWIVSNGPALLATSSMFGSSVTQNGYQKLPSGLIIQWGMNTTNAGGYVDVTYPIAFPNHCFTVSMATREQVASGSVTYTSSWDDATNFQSLTTFRANGRLNNVLTSMNFTWLAIGN